ncbi:MAG: hypothetical protein AAFZ18_03080 [Myxococcota bacterium]
MKKVRRVFAVLLAVVVFKWVMSCGATHDGPSPVKKLTNRVWMDRAPDGPRQRVLSLVLLKKGKRRIGAAVDGSAFRFAVDVLRHRVQGRELTLVFPQDGRKVRFQVRTWRCDDAPAPFDLCLELKAGGRRLVLYSEEQQQLGERLAPHVAGAVEAAGAETFEQELDAIETAPPAWFQRFAR